MAGAANGLKDAEWEHAYRSDYETYQACAQKLAGVIRDLLDSAEIEVVEVECRAKDPDSLVKKVHAKKDRYAEPLAEVTDLIGVRVIAYYLEDVAAISAIVDDEFAVDAENSMDKLETLEPDQFGYRSVHQVISLKPPRDELQEWAIFDGKRAEVQIRTATQHAWAAIEHKLNYKKTREAPREIRRKLTRLSALFEMADEEFSAVKASLGEVEARYSTDVKDGNLDLPIDTASLDVYLDGNAKVEGFIERARSAGFDISPVDADGYQDRLESDLRDMVLLLDRLGVETLADLDKILAKRKEIDGAIDLLGPLNEAAIIVWRTPIDVLTALICFQQEAPVEVFDLVYSRFVIEIVEKARKASAA